MSHELLIVDDDLGDIRIIEESVRLARGDVKITAITDGEAALAHLKSKRPGLVFLDLNMPGFSGFDILEAVKAQANTKAVPVVVLTTSDNPRDIQGAYDRLANAYVTKPVDLGDFECTVRDTLEFWFGIARLPPAA